jgi:crotonobetainyl-CoA:carnitine CoA-transferase CaiB-like acyl-CoA transferase
VLDCHDAGERGVSVADRGGSEGSFLRGVRVLEIADELGEYCGKVLAGLGADVVKVEPLGGELTRLYGPFYDDRVDPNRSLYFWHYNFGKRSVCVDLDSASGREQFLGLARSADVVLDSRPRQYLPSLGLGYEELRSENSGLIYSRISAFGDDGPWADYKGSDLVHLALGGVMLNCGYDPTPEGFYETPPVAPQMWQSYQIAGEVNAISVVAALYYRLYSGRGQQLSTAVHEVVAKNTESDVPDWVYQRSSHSRLTCRHSFAVTTDDGTRALPATPGLASTKDGRWILPYQTYLAGGGPSVEALFSLLEKHGLGHEVDRDRANDPGYFHNLESVIGKLINSYTLDRGLWLEAQDHGCTWAPVRRPEENLGDRHWSSRETFMEVDHPEMGRSFTEVGAKWYAPGLPWRTGPRAPLIGEHTAEVLAEVGQSQSKVRLADSPVRHVEGSTVSRWGTPWALAGVRVIDLGWILASAGGGRFLAALGAEVIKVEHTSKLDMMRLAGSLVPDGLRAERDAATGPCQPTPSDGVNRGGGFMEINTGKRAISLNLKADEGKELLKRLIRDADVLVEGYSPGTMDRMGLSYKVLKEINPALVYVQQSGMGQAGVYGRMKTFGPTAQAMSGISELSGLPEPYPPAGIGYSYLDWFGAYQIALAMMAGLYRLRVTGQGCWIDSSQVETGLYLTGSTILDYGANGRRWNRYGNRSPYKRAAPHGAFRVLGTDRWITIAAFTQEEWLALTRTLGHPEWANDVRFATLDQRMDHQDALEALVDEATGARDGVELMEALQAVGVPAGICESAEDRCEWDPQLRHLGWMMEFDQSEIGRWPAKTPPTRFSETPAYQGGLVDRHGPNYGEDNDYVYGRVLGISSEEIERLTQEGVI